MFIEEGESEHSTLVVMFFLDPSILSDFMDCGFIFLIYLVFTTAASPHIYIPHLYDVSIDTKSILFYFTYVYLINVVILLYFTQT